MIAVHGFSCFRPRPAVALRAMACSLRSPLYSQRVDFPTSKAGLPAIAQSAIVRTRRPAVALRAMARSLRSPLYSQRVDFPTSKAGLPAVARSEAESEGWYARRGANPQPSAP